MGLWAKSVVIFGSVSNVEVGRYKCHTGIGLETIPHEGMAHADIYRRPMPELPKRPHRQTRQNGPQLPALPVPESGLYGLGHMRLCWLIRRDLKSMLWKRVSSTAYAGLL